MNHKLKSFGTSSIIAPNSSGSWVEYTSKEDIEACCQQENSQHFSQTTLTPFMISPLVDIFGYLAQGPATYSVIDGSFVPPPGTNPYAVKLLSELNMDAAVREATPMRVVFLSKNILKDGGRGVSSLLLAHLGLLFPISLLVLTTKWSLHLTQLWQISLMQPATPLFDGSLGQT
jgi:hypothetical protein